MKKKKLLLILGALLLAIVIATPVLAATTAVVTVTYTPRYIAISIAPTTWTLNGLTGDSLIDPSITYYSNPLGDTTSPTAGGATDAECYFTITNPSTVHIDIKVTAADASGGSSNMTNSNTGSAAATVYGARSYFSGQATAAWEIAKSSGSSVGLSDLGETTDIKCGIIIATQTNPWAGASPSTIVITWLAIAH